jgi:hypothetical protein
VRGGWDTFDIDGGDVDMLSVGLMYHLAK